MNFIQKLVKRWKDNKPLSREEEYHLVQLLVEAARLEVEEVAVDDRENLLAELADWKADYFRMKALCESTQKTLEAILTAVQKEREQQQQADEVLRQALCTAASGSTEPKPGAKSLDLPVGTVVRAIRHIDPEGANAKPGELGTVIDEKGSLVRWLNGGFCHIYDGDVEVEAVA